MVEKKRVDEDEDEEDGGGFQEQGSQDVRKTSGGKIGKDKSKLVEVGLGFGVEMGFELGVGLRTLNALENAGL